MISHSGWSLNNDMEHDYIPVENVAFNRGFYTVDVKYFYSVTMDVFAGVGRPTEVTGLATFDKRVILFGSEGNAKIFSSVTSIDSADRQSAQKANKPTAICEVVDPICLNVKLMDSCDCHHYGYDLHEIPESVGRFFDDEFVLDGGDKRVYCTLGQFSIIRLERDTQLVIPCYDFCMPEKECIGSSDDNPCELFKRIKFPVDEFFPPAPSELTDYRDARENCCK